MTELKHAERREVDINLVDQWEKNPKNIKKANYERLKAQMLELGIYKPRS